MPSHRVIFAVSPHPFAIVVALVASYIHYRAVQIKPANRLKEIHGSYDIGGIGLDWIVISTPNNSLCCHVYNNFRPAFADRLLEAIEIPDVADYRVKGMSNSPLLEEIRSGWRCQRVPCHLGTERFEPQRKPAAFETRVTCKKHTAVLPELPIGHHSVGQILLLLSSLV